MDELKQTLGITTPNALKGFKAGTFSKVAGNLADVAGFEASRSGILADAESVISSNAVVSKQHRQNAQVIKALGQHRNLDIQKTGDVVKSDITATGAATLGGMDPDVVNRLADIEAEIDFRKRTSTAVAEQQSAQQSFAADVKDWQSELTRKASKRAAKAKRFSSIQSALSMFQHGSLFSKYGPTPTPVRGGTYGFGIGGVAGSSGGQTGAGA